MKNAPRGKKGEDVELNMTPMIDVVFQLIIFFMLVSEMAQADLESLELPCASMAQPDPGSDDGRIVVNILPPSKDGSCDFKVRGRTLSLINLREHLRIEACLARDVERPDLSVRPLLIRADTGTPYRYVQAVMQECARPGIGIYRIQFAVREPEAVHAGE